ncbi:hypothetical protein SAMN05216480_101428 [Pustulibacterium marinum]|uniref:Phosphate-selective porin O and P n=1 Tax=Pustulibacterium marinum TaxID=1224947 RepID=A0A1I7EYL9_9FLAO|nr:hypothetical protein [Pustulibacterium marinum]SFU28999.1 hypothetical protein SAMN05216480_101428 [Pustulibacterium marinum]
MRNFWVIVLFLVNLVSFGQELNQATLQDLKEQIKEELKAEMKQEKDSLQKKSTFNLSNFDLKGYGVVNYYNYNYDTDPTLKDKFDPERLNLYLFYHFSDKISFKSEIEFEHGGTASTLSYDTQEEFGEFEDEIEKGGGVKLEQAHINFQMLPWLNARVGRLKVYFGLHQTLDDPTEYFTTHRQEMENEILPLGWYENGVEIYGTFAKKFNYRAYVVSGLDASGFSSRGWIKEGYQSRFEMATAESVALAARLDYQFGTHKNTFVGLAGYINNAAANRPKDDMEESAYVTMVEGHISYNEKNLRFNAIGLYGNLENSNIVSNKNANLSNNLGVKRTPVGKNALGVSAELGYNILSFIKPTSAKKLYAFGRYDYYDTMFDVEGSIVDNPRWERSSITAGFNYYVYPKIVLKIQYGDRKLGSENYDQTTLVYTGHKQHDKTFSTGIGFKF